MLRWLLRYVFFYILFQHYVSLWFLISNQQKLLLYVNKNFRPPAIASRSIPANGFYHA